MKLLEMVRSSGTRAGWYCYEKGDRTPHPDPEVAVVKKSRY
jgi:3-hydroxyacyl-CoA dehydrogenase